MIEEKSFDQVMKQYDRTYYPHASKTYADGYEDGFRAGKREAMQELCEWITSNDASRLLIK